MPLSVTYEIIFETTKQRFVRENVEGQFIIKTPPLEQAGSFVIDLIDVTDANGCSKVLDTQDITIEILAQRPSVSFACTKPIYFLEGTKARIPLSITGTGPIEISYVHEKVCQVLIVVT